MPAPGGHWSPCTAGLARSGVALSSDGRLVACGSGDGTVQLWETDTGRPVSTLQGHTSVAFSVAMSADGQLVAKGGWGGTARLWEANTGTPLRMLQPERRYKCLDITGLPGACDRRTAHGFAGARRR